MSKRTILLILLASLCSAIGCSRGDDARNPGTNGRNESASRSPRSSTQTGPETRTLRGLVVGIMDGDTIELLDDEKTSYRIRLKGIDAPEKRQAFGNASRGSLADMVAGKTVTVEWEKLDRNGRVIGKILIDDRDVCLDQIKAGLAWHYKKFEAEQSEVDQVLYSEAEQQARSEKRGLWQDSSQTPPWEFRPHKRPKHLSSIYALPHRRKLSPDLS